MTHALLVTDLVDSTKLAESLGDTRAADLWARHDRAARDLLLPHRGREIDKTDGFLLLFESAAEAAAYALAYHRAIGELEPPLKARAGLHVGAVILTENAAADVARGAKPLEVDGLAKPVAARVMSLAVGGQTLATPEAVDALVLARTVVAPDGEARGDGLLAVSHGHWQLKGVTQPVELFELGVRGEAPFVPPPDAAKAWRVRWLNEAWVPVREVKRHLRAERDTFVGREADLQELSRRLDDGARLVTVLGIGGTGKTRLVTHYAWTWLGSWPGGAWFCDLSEARSVEGIASAVATALDVPLGKGDPVVQLGHAIAGRGKCLVVLDNFEQVARHAPATLGQWLDRASEAQFVVTTREVLGLPGETALALAPLAEDDAANLFVARAQQAKGDFVLTEADRPHVRALVKLLDGLPLAIELAAARVRVMAPSVLVERMTERFRLLTSSGGRHTRQATLRATLDWSWELLSADEQAALAQLSVFEGGFTVEAAEAVLSLEEAWPIDAVQALVDKSLVRRVGDDRFDLLVSVQEYAAEKLDVLGARAQTQSRHGAYYATFGTEEAVDALDTHGGVARRRVVAAELDNLVAGGRRAIGRADAERAVALLAAAWAVLELRGPFVVAVDLARTVLAVPELPDGARGRVLRVLGRAQYFSGRMDEARTRLDQALAVHSAVGDRRFEGVVLGNLGLLHWEQGRMDEARAHHHQALAVAREVRNRSAEGYGLTNLGILYADQGRMDEARAHYDKALAVARDVGNRRSEGNVLGNLGILHKDQGRIEEARAYYGQALAVHREVGNRNAEGNVLSNLGVLCMVQGRMDEAHAHFDQALAVHREVGNRRLEGVVLGNQGILHQAQGRVGEARAHYDQALAVHREVGDDRSEGVVLGNLGNLHKEQRRMDEARAHYDQALALHREVGNRRFEGIVLGNLGVLHLDQGRLDEARASLEAGERLLRAVDDPSQLGNLLVVRARLEHAEGHPEVARQTLAEAEALADQVGAGPDSELGRALAKARAALQAA